MSTTNLVNPPHDSGAISAKLAYKARGGRSAKRMFVVFSFLAPALILYTLFMLYPMADAVRLSFFNWDGAAPAMNFVGMDNYTHLAKDSVFMKSLFNNFYWVILSLILMVLPTLALSALIAKVKIGKMFFRAGFYLPSVLSLAVIGVLWAKIYDPVYGPINVLLKLVGLESIAQNWLGEPMTVIPALVVTSTWAFYGTYMVLFLAGLQNIDKSMYEAADIDGAGIIGKFWNITVPSLRNTMNVVVSMVVIHALKGFGLVWIMTQGGPFYKSEVVATYVYKAAFSMNKVSYAAAGSVVLGVIVIALTIAFNYWRDKGE